MNDSVARTGEAVGSHGEGVRCARLVEVGMTACTAIMLLVLVAGTAVSGASASATTRPLAKAPRLLAMARIQPDLSNHATKTATNVARKFVESSGCPLMLEKVEVVGQVTKRSRSKDARRIVAHTLLTTGAGDACTGVTGLRGQPLPAAYRSGVKRATAVGDVVVRFRWIDAAGKNRQTLGVVTKGRNSKIQFEPVMWSYAPPSPAGVPGPTGRSAAPVHTTAPTQTARIGPIVSTVSWKPWGGDWAIVAVNGYGKTVVRKEIFMRIHADAAGNIAVEDAYSMVENAWGYKVVPGAYGPRDKSRIVDRGGMYCLELTVDISYETPLRGWHGKQVYTLCPDGTSEYVG